MQPTYQTYEASCRQDWFAALSKADWEKAGKPANTADWQRMRGYTPPTERQVISEDGLAITQKIKPKNAPKVDGKMRIADMLKAGKLAKGATLTVKGKDATATIIDAKQVLADIGGKQIPMSWNEFGQRAVGHKAVNVYVWLQVDGKLLNDLR